MPKQDDDFEFGGDGKASHNLAKAINNLAKAADRLTDHLESNAVNRCDLQETEDRILKAIKDISKGTELSPQDQAILDNLNALAEARAKRLEALAAQTPNA